MARPDDPDDRPRRGTGKRRPSKRGPKKRPAGKRRGSSDRDRRPPTRRGKPPAGSRRPRTPSGNRRTAKPPARKPPARKPPAGTRGAGRPPPKRSPRPKPSGARRTDREPTGGEAAAVFREARRAAQRARREERSERPPEPPAEPEIWIDEGRVDDPSTRARRRPEHRRGRKGPPDRRPPTPRPRQAGPLSRLSKKEQNRLHEASVEFQQEHFSDARKLLADLAAHHPDIAEIRELHGLALYRLERWREAARELEAFHDLTGSAEQNPVLADCYRALQRHTEVDELWDELAAQSPSAPVVAEGRIVTAASLADRGDLHGAIRLLDASPTRRGKARPHDLRVWYALADLYDRAGDQPRARDLFARVVQHDSAFADAARRLTDLG